MKRARSKIRFSLLFMTQKLIKQNAVKESRPQYFCDEFSRTQIAFLQRMVDGSIDWLNAYVRETLTSKIDEFAERGQQRFEKLKTYA